MINIKQNVIEIPFTDRYKYLTGSEIAGVVKYYKGYNFKTYNDFHTIQSNKKWTPEQNIEYRKKDSEINNFIYQKGKDFENTLIAMIRDSNLNVTDYSIMETSFANNDLRISATLDAVVKSEKHNTVNIIEAKNSRKNSGMLQHYKYQVATQSLLLPDFDITEAINNVIIYFGLDEATDISFGNLYTPYKCNKQEILDMQQEIIDCSKQFWIDNENNNFSFITFEEAMKEFAAKEVFVENDAVMVDKFKKYCDIKNKIKILEEEEENLKIDFLDKYMQNNSVEFTGEARKISIRKFKMIKIDKHIIIGEINKLETDLSNKKKELVNIGDTTILKNGRSPYIVLSKIK